jgi:hypothetical protein
MAADKCLPNSFDWELVMGLPDMAGFDARPLRQEYRYYRKQFEMAREKALFGERGQRARYRSELMQVYEQYKNVPATPILDLGALPS